MQPQVYSSGNLSFVERSSMALVLDWNLHTRESLYIGCGQFFHIRVKTGFAKDSEGHLTKTITRREEQSSIIGFARSHNKRGICGRRLMPRSPSVIGSSPIGGATKLSTTKIESSVYFGFLKNLRPLFSHMYSKPAFVRSLISSFVSATLQM